MIDDGKFIFHETTDCLLDQYGLLKLTEEQFNQVDHNYFIKTEKRKLWLYCFDRIKNNSIKKTIQKLLLKRIVLILYFL